MIYEFLKVLPEKLPEAIYSFSNVADYKIDRFSVYHQKYIGTSWFHLLLFVFFISSLLYFSAPVFQLNTLLWVQVIGGM